MNLCLLRLPDPILVREDPNQAKQNNMTIYLTLLLEGSCCFMKQLERSSSFIELLKKAFFGIWHLYQIIMMSKDHLCAMTSPCKT